MSIKKLTKRIWYGSETITNSDGKVTAVAPPVAINDGSEDWDLNGLVRGELYLNDNADDPALFCLGADDKPKRIGGGTGTEGGGTIDIEVNIEQGEGINIGRTIQNDKIKYIISHGNTSEGESTANEGTFVVKNVLVDKFGHVIGLESNDISLTFDNKYLRKDKPDSTDYLLGLNGGATFGTYVGGFLGSGGKFDKNGYIEANGLTLREFLEVPELRFNRIDVVSGELWNSIAFGLIESVDTENQIVTLKLEEGELSGLHINDFCRGIFHNLTGNETVSGTDSAGFDTIAGFSTSYFTPVEIVDNAHFKYELKPGTSVHPTASMKFSVYGNATDKNRQASAYSTRKYKRYLINVDTWEINPSKNITYQEGDLSNLVINGESLDKGSVYLNNVYFGGNIWNVPGLDNNFKGDDAYSAVLSTYSAVYNIADGIYSQVEIVTGDDTVMTGSDIVVASEFSVSTIIQAYKGANKLRYSDVVGEGKYLVTSEGEGCKYTITDGLVAVQEVTEDKATINLHVNCEGMSTFDLLFAITRVKNGEDGTDYEYIYTRTYSSSIPSTPSTKQEDDYVPTGWTDDPVGPTPSLPYEWVSKREKFHDVWGEYSTPALWAKYSFDGEDGSQGNPGEDGKTTYQVYRRSSSQPATPTGTWFPPSGWALDPPVGDTPLWMSKAIFNGNGTIYSSWSTPVRITGDTGASGSNGPALTFRGEYSGSKQYTGTSDHVEVVYTGSGSSRRYFMTKTTAGTFTGQYPGNDTSYWKAFQGQFENIATGLLFAEEANIAGWWFSNSRIESQSRNVLIDGNADNGPRIALGATYANRNSAPARMYDDGSVVFRKGDIGGFTLSDTDLSSEFTDMFGYSSKTLIKSDNDAAIQISNSNNEFAGFGLTAKQGYVGAMAFLKTGRLITTASPITNFSALRIEFDSNSLDGAAVINIGRASTSSNPRIWLNCGHVEGWGSNFRVESRYLGDSNNMERTVINAKLASRAALESKGVVSSPNWKALYYDENSGNWAWG